MPISHEQLTEELVKSLKDLKTTSDEDQLLLDGIVSDLKSKKIIFENNDNGKGRLSYFLGLTLEGIRGLMNIEVRKHNKKILDEFAERVKLHEGLKQTNDETVHSRNRPSSTNPMGISVNRIKMYESAKQAQNQPQRNGKPSNTGSTRFIKKK